MTAKKILSLRYVIVLFGISLIYNYSFSQFKLDNWKIYSSMLDVRAAAIDSKGRIWAGTTGGLFVYDSTDTQPFREFRNSEGLLSMVFSSMVSDTVNKLIYIGSFDGYLEIADENFNFTHITDIVSAGFPNPVINDIYLRDTLAYIGGGFGLAVFDLKHRVFIESVTKLGSFQQKTPVKQILIKNNQIWLATEAGIATADLNSQIIDPQVWKNYTSTNGLLSQQPVIGICFLNDTLYAATNKILYKMVKDTFIVLQTLDPNWGKFTKLSSKNNKLYYTTDFDVFSLENGTYNLYLKDQLINSHILSDKAMIVMYQELGLRIFDFETSRVIKPNTPASNLFMSLSLDDKGNLWSATDIEGRGKGFMKLSNGKWTNYTTKEYPQLIYNDYYKIFSDKKGRIFASSWGSGLCVLEESDTGAVIKIINNKNSPMKGVAEDSNWVIAGEFVSDNNGTIWFPNYGRLSPGPSLIAYKKDGTFEDFDNCVNNQNRTFIAITIDFSGTKWLGSSPFDPLGLMYFNENNTLDDKSDDICGVLNESSTNSKLLDNAQTALAVDQLGALWIGFEEGLAVMFNPSAVLNSGKSNLSIRKVNLLGSQRVNDIFIDALNNKWIATNNGIWVLNPDGTETTAIINKTNSPLIDNFVFSVVIDNETGKAYFGTKKGLCVANSLSIKPLANYNISCYPQPFKPGIDDALTIDGLAADSDIRILTVDGEFVKSISVTGRKAIWDGRNTNGEFVSSGIYLILTSSLSSNATSVGKIAVIGNK